MARRMVVCAALSKDLSVSSDCTSDVLIIGLHRPRSRGNHIDVEIFKHDERVKRAPRTGSGEPHSPFASHNRHSETS